MKKYLDEAGLGTALKLVKESMPVKRLITVKDGGAIDTEEGSASEGNSKGYLNTETSTGSIQYKQKVSLDILDEERTYQVPIVKEVCYTDIWNPGTYTWQYDSGLFIDGDNNICYLHLENSKVKKLTAFSPSDLSSKADIKMVCAEPSDADDKWPVEESSQTVWDWTTSGCLVWYDIAKIGHNGNAFCVYTCKEGSVYTAYAIGADGVVYKHQGTEVTAVSANEVIAVGSDSDTETSETVYGALKASGML